MGASAADAGEVLQTGVARWNKKNVFKTVFYIHFTAPLRPGLKHSHSHRPPSIILCLFVFIRRLSTSLFVSAILRHEHAV